MAYTSKTIHSGDRHDGYSTKDANDLDSVLSDMDTALAAAGNVTQTSDALTDSSGGSASDQTLAAMTNVDTLTDSTGGVADDTMESTRGCIVTDTTTVDASAGGTAQTTNVTLVPAGAVILNVEAKVVTPFDGDTTTTLEVGVSGNDDAYIDTSDFDPSAAADTVAGSASGTNNDIKYAQYVGAATQLVATWTNTANATAGSVSVTVQYMTVGIGGADSQKVNNNFKEITDQIITQEAFNTVTANTVAKLAEEVNALIVDVAAIISALG